MARKPEVTVKVSADTKGAQKDLQDLGKHSEGLGDKLKDLKHKGKELSEAGIAAFAVEGVMAFEHLGVSVGKLHDATGVSYEDASRLTKVFGDMGISSEDLQKSLGYMEKKLGANADAFAKYGVEVVKGKDGQVDANATFLNGIDALNKMTDPTKRAAAGAAMFGKSWQNMAEAVGANGDKLRENLAAVSGAELFDEKKVEQARQLRESFKEIKHAGEELFLTIGQALAPVIAKLAPKLVELIRAAEPLAVAIGDVLGPALEAIGPIIEGLMPVIKALATVLGDAAKVIAWGLGPHSEAKKSIDSMNAQLAILKEQATKAGVSGEDFQKQWTAAMKQASDDGAKGFDVQTQALANMANATTETDRENRRLTAGVVTATQAINDQAETEKEVSKQIADHQKAQADLNKVVEDAKKTTDEYLKGLQDIRQAHLDAVASTGNLEQKTRDLDSSYFGIKTKIEENTKAHKDGKLSADEKAQSDRDLLTAEHNMAQGVLDTAATYAESRGDVKNSTADIQDQINFLEIQKTKYPELRAEIDQYIAKLKETPPEIGTNVKLHLDAHIDNLIVDGETHAAGVASGGVKVNGGVKHSAQGNHLNAGEPSVVGEQGTEMFVPDTAGTVIPNNRIGGGGTTIVYQNFPAGTRPEDVVEAQRLYNRRNGTS